MMPAPETRVGWCPGARRPMPSRDGLIVRVKPRGAMLSPDQAIGMAAAARRFGSGALDLTNRANLQIRGASEMSLPALTEALDGLGLLDPDLGAETRRNVMMSPLAGLDPEALLDIRPVVAALEARLSADEGLAGLPAKFGFAVSDGGRLALGDVGADVTFDAAWPPSPSREGITRGFAVRLAGAADTVASCPAQSVPEVAARLAGWFVAARAADPDLRRMRHAVARFGAGAILAAVGLCPEISLHPQSSWPGSSRPPTPTGADSSDGKEPWRFGVGHLALRAGVGGRDKPGHDEGECEPVHVLGVAAPFGRIDAAQLDALARGALRAGASQIRLTPWRTLLVAGPTRPGAEELAAACAAVGLIVDPADPRLRVAACPGETGCHRGTTPVLDHAVRWAALLGRGHVDDGIALHVSGCAKGCAHPATAPVTLVAENGRYRFFSHGLPGPAGLDAEAVHAILVAASEGRST